MFRRTTLALMCAVFAHIANAETSTTIDAGRGALLYDTHCIACHDTKVHWRDKRLATDWASLRSEVRRWQDNASLGWSNADIEAVTQYVNTRYYRFPALQ